MNTFPTALIVLGILFALMSVLGLSSLDQLAGPQGIGFFVKHIAFWR